jgi:hypothetical protein
MTIFGRKPEAVNFPHFVKYLKPNEQPKNSNPIKVTPPNDILKKLFIESTYFNASFENI